MLSFLPRGLGMRPFFHFTTNTRRIWMGIHYDNPLW